MAGIFVSYRRDDSRDIAGRLVDRLRQDYATEQLFLDIDAIPAGTNFETVLADRLKACDVLLAVIGPQWVNAKDANGKRRLDEPGDYVRREIAAALQRNDVRVIPLLVSGAEMPRADNLPDDLKPLAARQNYQLRYERFNADANDLVAQLATVVRPASRRRFGRWAIPLGALAVFVAAGVIYHLATSVSNPNLARNDPVLREEAIKLCREASEVTARLASSSDRADWTAARNRFWVLYNGPLYTIETKEKEKSPDKTSPLEGAMVRFGRLLKEAGDKPEKLPLTTLDQGSLAVARACKDTVERM
jgi:TIR domain